MDWSKLRVFHAVAKAGSFTHATNTLHLSQSAISRQITALEESLDVPLFHRHARGLILTGAGKILYTAVQDVFQTLTTTQTKISAGKLKPIGPLRINTSQTFGTSWLSQRLGRFLKKFPHLEVELILTDDPLDLTMDKADVAIRMAPPKQTELIQRPLMTFYSQIYASNDYIKEHKIPKTIKELDDHDIIAFCRDSPHPVPDINWLLRYKRNADSPRKPILRVNNTYGIYRAVRAGIGIAAIPEYMLPKSTSLHHILPSIKGPSTTAYFIYPQELRQSKKLAVFRDFLQEEVKSSTEHNNSST